MNILICWVAGAGQKKGQTGSWSKTVKRGRLRNTEKKNIMKERDKGRLSDWLKVDWVLNNGKW